MLVQDNGAQAGFQGTNPKGLEEVAVHFAFGSGGDDLFSDFPGDHEKGGGFIPGIGAEAAQEFQAIHVRHVNVADHQIITAFLQSFPGLQTIGGLSDIPAYTQSLEHLAEHAADGRHVIHHQDLEQGEKALRTLGQWQLSFGLALRHESFFSSLLFFIGKRKRDIKKVFGESGKFSGAGK